MKTLAQFVCASAVMLACSCAKPLGLPEGCQPSLGGADCFLPYPSDFYRQPDTAFPTGAHISPTGAARFTTLQGLPADPATLKPVDGFSTVPLVVFTLAAPTAPTGFPALATGGDESVDVAQSNTLLVEAESNTLIPHFVDFDPHASAPAKQALTLHAYVGLKPLTRYVVLVKGAVNSEGKPVVAPEGFRRLRDRQTAGDLQVEPLVATFETRVFPVAKAVGVDRAQLQLAWEFTTGSEAWATADLFKIRELTLAWLAVNTPAVTIESVTENPGNYDNVFRIVRGSITGPLFMDREAASGAKLVRDASGAVQLNGTVAFPFLAVIPKAVEAGSGASPTFLYGHGFFGSTNELLSPAQRMMAQTAKRTMVGLDFWGMSLSDIGKMAEALSTNPAKVPDLVDRAHQGLANWLVVSAAVEHFGALPAFQRTGGQALTTGKADCYLGISEGQILGGPMVAINPGLTRVAFQVGGAGLTGMMVRARPFENFMSFLDTTIHDSFEQQKYIATLQRHFDRIDPATYARFLQQAPLPDSQPRQVLFQKGLADDSVPNLAGWLHARLLGLKVLNPTPYVPWGLETADFPAKNGVIIIDSEHRDEAEFYRVADYPVITQTHNGVRLLPAVQSQIQKFFDTGDIVQTCAGVCDPE